MEKSPCKHAGWAVALSAACLLFIGAGCSEGLTEQQAQTEPAQPPERPTPTAQADPNIQLDVTVGLISNRILFTNRSGDVLQNILVVLNEGDGEFRHSVGIVQPFAMVHFGPNSFKRSDGTQLDPAHHKVKTFTVYADAPRGRGRWYGSY